MKHRITTLLILSTLTLSACGSTLEGIQRDFGKIASGVNNKVADLRSPDVENRADVVDKSGDLQDTSSAMRVRTATSADGCPPINVDPQLDSMTEFYDAEKPSDTTRVSTIKLTGATSECSKDGEYLTMRVDLNFEGDLGPKARRKDGDRPFFAYPYFIAVKDDQGNELAKELFAASVTYEDNQNSMALVETIKQKLPLNDDGTLPPYQIEIGFQLTEDQLFYNASM